MGWQGWVHLLASSLRLPGFNSRCLPLGLASASAVEAWFDNGRMHKKYTVQSALFGKDNFMVTVYPNIDYAFVVALIVILDDINTVSQSSST
ncbi:hypothetical protein TIFTF001_009720 [Ficus carica]|uniref:Uncharacterized protein n=1 Tax=Ficus carica TaxID=3494 RepID=A0AA88D1J7_FICCA|nr:hypothetical protein TIFTF001_009720 [Ficus carica]